MNDRDQQPELTRTQLIFAAADGELSSADLARFEAMASEDETVAERVEHEHKLRRAVAESMADTDAPPAGLRDRVRAAMAQVSDAELATGFDPLADEPTRAATQTPAPAVIESKMGDTRSSAFWTKLPGYLAVAATLALVASVLIVAMSMSRPLYADPQAGARVVSFLEREHDACADFNSFFNRKMRSKTIDEARQMSAQHLGKEAYALTLDPQTWADAMLEFKGFGPCGVPGTERSGHMLLQGTTNPDLVISLFVAPDNGSLDFSDSEGTCCFVQTLSDGDANDPAGTVTVWRREGLVYFLYAPDETGMESARFLLGTPENHRRLY